jgi:hypothetical protein
MNAGKHLRHSRQGLERNLLRLSLIGPLLLVATQAQAGAACVVAKRLGDSLAIEWVAAPEESASSALAKAGQRLIEQGYRTKGQDIHAQACSELPHAYMAIVKTQYTTAIGHPRTSYGCGYSARSAAEAEHSAVYDLRNYSWGWKPAFGYEVIKALRY